MDTGTDQGADHKGMVPVDHHVNTQAWPHSENRGAEAAIMRDSASKGFNAVAAFAADLTR